MDGFLPQLLLLLLLPVWVCRAQSPEFCHSLPCPKFQLVAAHQGFDERLYVATDWASTPLAALDPMSGLAANKRLRAFWKKCNGAGQEIPESWPVLVTVSHSEDRPKMFLSWFVPPGMKLEPTVTSVTLEHREATTVYVRTYKGTPSVKSGEENVQKLQEALVKAGKAFNGSVSATAVYESYFAISHHNEAWIYSA